MTRRFGVIAMLACANIFNALAEETNSPPIIENLFAPPLPLTNAPPPKLFPALDVRAYVVQGYTPLPVQEFGVLSNYTGKVDFNRLHEGLDELQSLYRDSGLTDVSVSLPVQNVTNGIVHVEVLEPGVV